MRTDIYFSPDYGKLYETIEGGKAVCWKYSGAEGEIVHQFILRKIPEELDHDWFDIVTPYGYGGPLILNVSEGYSREQLAERFHKSFEQYCREQNIVSEFVRFHPILNNADDFKNVYEISFNRHTRGTNLCGFDDPVTAEFTRGCRKLIRQLMNKGVSWKITESPQNLEVFRKIYYATMNRNSADEYYYFDDTYFKQCQQYFNSSLLLVEAIYREETIAAGLYFTFDKVIHAHLSGTLPQYLDLSPAYVLKYCTVIWGKERGYDLIHYGGGKTSDVQDSLYLFKKKFSQNTEFEFFIGKKIWNREIYDKLCQIHGETKRPEYFPLYRS